MVVIWPTIDFEVNRRGVEYSTGPQHSIFKKYIISAFKRRVGRPHIFKRKKKGAVSILKRQKKHPEEPFARRVSIWINQKKIDFLQKSHFFAIFRENPFFRKLPFWLQKGIKNWNFVDANIFFGKYGPSAFQNPSDHPFMTFGYDFRPFWR